MILLDIEKITRRELRKRAESESSQSTLLKKIEHFTRICDLDLERIQHQFRERAHFFTGETKVRTNSLGIGLTEETSDLVSNQKNHFESKSIRNER